MISLKMNVELPYVSVSVRGLKPSNKSKVAIIQVKDPDLGDFLIELFITAGEVPAHIVHTKFGPGTKGKQYNSSKAPIHAQNNKSISEAKIMPSKFSDGKTSDGICAQLVKVFSLKDSKAKELNCGNLRNVPIVQSNQLAFQPSMIQPTATQPSNILNVQNPFLNVPAFNTMAPSIQQAPAFGLPAGAVAVTVPNYQSLKKQETAYQMPGGPRPIAVGKTWYWYIATDAINAGNIIKSKDKYHRPGAVSKIATGNQQKRVVEKILPLADKYAGIATPTQPTLFNQAPRQITSMPGRMPSQPVSTGTNILQMTSNRTPAVVDGGLLALLRGSSTSNPISASMTQPQIPITTPQIQITTQPPALFQQPNPLDFMGASTQTNPLISTQPTTGLIGLTMPQTNPLVSTQPNPTQNNVQFEPEDDGEYDYTEDEEDAYESSENAISFG